MRFRDVPQFTDSGSYRVDVSWSFLEKHLASYEADYALELNPEFQRGHVWTREQQIAYIDFILRGGRSARDVWLNCFGWNGGGGPMRMLLVDGLQRITAVLAFLHNEFRVCAWVDGIGCYFRDFTDELTVVGPSFKFHVNDLPTYKDVLRWYVEINEGGTPHTAEEITRVKALMDTVDG